MITDFDVNGDPIPLGAGDFVVIGQSRHPDAGNVLVPVRDAAELAAALKKLIDDAALRCRMGGQSRLLAEKEFGQEAVIAQTLAVYREVCA